MTLADVLPYIGAFGPIFTLVGAAYVFQRAQWLQHGANIMRLDLLSERVKAIEEIAKQQTEILVSYARIEVRVDGHDTRFDEHGSRISKIEDREAGRRIGTAKGS